MGELVLFPGTQDVSKPATHQRRPEIIEIMQEGLAAAESGKLQAVAIVYAYADDEDAVIQWAPNPLSRDYQKIVTGLTVLLHQLAALVPHATIDEEDEDVAT